MRSLTRFTIAAVLLTALVAALASSPVPVAVRSTRRRTSTRTRSARRRTNEPLVSLGGR